MTGILCNLVGASSGTVFLNTSMTSATASDGAKTPTYCTGYSDGSTTPTYNSGAAIGSMTSTSYRGATVVGIYNTTYGGNSIGISGNRASTFVTGIVLNGTYYAATFLSYNSTQNVSYWTFGATLTTGSYTVQLLGS